MGHETDLTLIDFASDKIDPTPTAAAEFAVPVRSQLMQTLQHYGNQLLNHIQNKLSLHESRLEALKRGLPSLESWLNDNTQKLDDLTERLTNANMRFLQQQTVNLDHVASRLAPTLSHIVDKATQRFDTLTQLLDSYSYTRTLERGFAFVTGEDQSLIPSKTKTIPHQKVQIHFYDGIAKAEILKVR